MLKGVVNVAFLNDAFHSTSFPNHLKYSAILDSGATIHVFNDLSRFMHFRKAPRGDCLQAGNSIVPILGYGDVEKQTVREGGKRGTLRLKMWHFVPILQPILSLDHLTHCKG